MKFAETSLCTWWKGFPRHISVGSVILCSLKAMLPLRTQRGFIIDNTNHTFIHD